MFWRKQYQSQRGGDIFVVPVVFHAQRLQIWRPGWTICRSRGVERTNWIHSNISSSIDSEVEFRTRKKRSSRDFLAYYKVCPWFDLDLTQQLIFMGNAFQYTWHFSWSWELPRIMGRRWGYIFRRPFAWCVACQLWCEETLVCLPWLLLSSLLVSLCYVRKSEIVISFKQVRTRWLNTRLPTSCN